MPPPIQRARRRALPRRRAAARRGRPGALPARPRAAPAAAVHDRRRRPSTARPADAGAATRRAGPRPRAPAARRRWRSPGPSSRRWPGSGALDTPGLVDLAEVRWRTGDLLGAGEAAAAALARRGRGDPVALVIAAEAASALGRPSEARRLARPGDGRCAGGRSTRSSPGMPRSAVWPPDAAEPPPTAPTLFDREPERPPPADAGAPRAERRGRRRAAPRRRRRPRAGPMTLGFWDGDGRRRAGRASCPDPAAELEAGRTALVAGALDEAALRFGLALRLAPALAPAVLEATEGARSVGLSIVRGDAYRLAGHEAEARQAYAVAARGGPPERRVASAHDGRPTPVSPARESPTARDEPADARRRRRDGVAGRELEAGRRRPRRAGRRRDERPARRAADAGRRPPRPTPRRRRAGPGRRRTRPDRLDRGPSDTIPRVHPDPYPR